MHHIRLARDTGDIDLAIVAEEAQCADILAAAGWGRDEHARQRWRHAATESIVDVLPATPRIIEAGRVRFEGDDKELSMIGFDLALANPAIVELDGAGLSVEIATLPALIMLKIVAWLDRPEERIKDLGDIGQMFDGALGDWDDQRWEKLLASIIHDEQGAFFVGQQLGAIAAERHCAKLEAFFEWMETGAWLAVMAREAAWRGADPEAIARRRLAAFRRGLGWT